MADGTLTGEGHFHILGFLCVNEGRQFSAAQMKEILSLNGVVCSSSSQLSKIPRKLEKEGFIECEIDDSRGYKVVLFKATRKGILYYKNLILYEDE